MRSSLPSRVSSVIRESLSIARRSVVMGILRLRSTFTVSRSRLLVSNSSQAPRLGISLAAQSTRPVVWSWSVPKYTPGERTS